MKVLNFALILALSLTTNAFAQIKFVKDILNGQDVSTGNGMPQRLDPVNVNGKLYFVAYSDLFGASIYTTDGTPEGTELILDLAVGPVDVNVNAFAAAGNNLFVFTLESTSSPVRILVYNLDEHTLNSLGSVEVFPNSRNMVALNDELYFTGKTPQQGYEVWKSNGTSAGTMMVKDVYPGAFDSNIPHNFHASESYVYFVAEDGVNGAHWWRTDGTENGTIRIPTKPFQEYTEWTAAVLGDDLYFTGKNEGNEGLYKTGGTPEGTVLVKEIPSVYTIKSFGDKILCWSYYAGFYTSDGTVDGTQKISDFGSISISTEFNGELYFVRGNELWKTDGTAEGTVKTNAKIPAGPVAISSNNSHVILMSYESGGQNQKYKLWAYDGENEDLVHLVNFTLNVPNVNYAKLMGAFNDKIFFSSDDNHHGSEPWMTDGTPEGTLMLADINNEIPTKHVPNGLTPIGSKLFFHVDDNIHGSELWVSDGTEEGTKLTRDINPGIEDSEYGEVLSLGNRAIFVALSKLWSSDGTEEGTIMLFDPTGTSGPSFKNSFIKGNHFYFEADNKVWKTDGVNSAIVVNALPIPWPYNFGAISNEKYVLFGSDGWMWVGDDTSAPAVKVSRVGTLFPSNGFEKIQVAGSFGYFVADGQEFNYEIWKTDGTPEGTKMVKDVSSSKYPNIEIHGRAGNRLIFAEDDGTHGKELWSTDGTVEGTFLLNDIYEGSETSGPSRLYQGDSFMFFRATTKDHKNTIWRTDGTKEGTELVIILDDDFSLSGLVYFKDQFFTIGASLETGEELWRIDFTTQKAQLVAELIAGPVSSLKYEIVATSDNLFFVGRDNESRYRLWKLDPDFTIKQSQKIIFDEIGEKKFGDGPIELSAVASSGLAVTFEVVSGPATISGSTLTITGSGSVTVRATQAGNDNYNEASAEQSFNVILATGLEDESEAITVWPNPATGKIYINTSDNHSISLNDLTGRSVLSINKGQNEFDVSHLPRGLYILKIKTVSDKNVIRKVILK